MNEKYLDNSFHLSLEDHIEQYNALIKNIDETDINIKAESILRKSSFDIIDLPYLLRLDKESLIKKLLEKSRVIRDQRFGRKIDLYAPLYISNYCINSCLYCGFNKNIKKQRLKLSSEEVEIESAYLKSKGIEHLLIVSGESDSIAGIQYYKEILEFLSKRHDSISFEVQPMSVLEYSDLYNAGLDGITVYQETYQKDFYAKYHIEGKKSDYRYRIETPERAAQANVPHIAIGSLLGLAPVEKELYLLASHLKYLIKKYWTVQFGVSFPRIINDGINFEVPYKITDLDFIKIVASMRLIFPDAPIYMSTREDSYMRDNMMQYSVTHMSVESKTDPGGYTAKNGDENQQFAVSDERKVEEFVKALKNNGLRPVFKDWDRSFSE